MFSFGIIVLQRILKFLRMTFLTARSCGWLVRVNGILLVSSFCDLLIDFLGTMFACGDSEIRVATFFEKLAHFLAHFLLKSDSSLQRSLSLRN